jgi:hypothetical protein
MQLLEWIAVLSSLVIGRKKGSRSTYPTEAGLKKWVGQIPPNIPIQQTAEALFGVGNITWLLPFLDKGKDEDGEDDHKEDSSGEEIVQEQSGHLYPPTSSEDSEYVEGAKNKKKKKRERHEEEEEMQVVL